MTSLFVLIVSIAFAHEKWLCVDESSQVQGNSVYSCGIGHGQDEDEARGKAFNSAKLEFDRICQNSTSCKDKAVSVQPQRTTCSQTDGKWKCFRLVVFTISKEAVRVVESRTTSAVEDFWKRYNKHP